MIGTTKYELKGKILYQPNHFVGLVELTPNQVLSFDSINSPKNNKIIRWTKTNPLVKVHDNSKFAIYIDTEYLK